jgi:hypothetical protein
VLRVARPMSNRQSSESVRTALVTCPYCVVENQRLPHDPGPVDHELEHLLNANCTRAQYGSDRDVLAPQKLTHLVRRRGEPPLAVMATRAYVLGLDMTKSCSAYG